MSRSVAAFVGLVGVGFAGAASASPIVFTFNPAAVPLSGASAFTADTINVKDYAQVSLGATTGSNTAFTETGFLQFNNVSLGAAVPFLPQGLNSAYSLYIQFNAAGVQNQASFTQSSSGTFTSLNYTLYGVNGATTFSVATGAPVATNGGTPTVIATGSIMSGGVSLTVVQGQGISPGASVVETVNETNPAFFVSPSSIALNLAGAFNNDVNLVTVAANGQSFLLNGGGGDITFAAVPEPVSLSILGAGLVSMGLLRRRRKN